MFWRLLSWDIPVVIDLESVLYDATRCLARIRLLITNGTVDGQASMCGVGLTKREVLKEALSAFGKEAFSCPCSFLASSRLARSKTLTKLARDWEDVLKRASEKADR